MPSERTLLTAGYWLAPSFRTQSLDLLVGSPG
jgi:hypothetical protein